METMFSVPRSEGLEGTKGARRPLAEISCSRTIHWDDEAIEYLHVDYGSALAESFWDFHMDWPLLIQAPLWSATT